MSKGSKRKGWKAVERDFKAAFPQPAKTAIAPIPSAHCQMSDDEIDKTFWNFGKADKSRMKKEAATERLRLHAMAILKEETNR